MSDKVRSIRGSQSLSEALGSPMDVTLEEEMKKCNQYLEDLLTPRVWKDTDKVISMSHVQIKDRRQGFLVARLIGSHRLADNLC